MGVVPGWRVAGVSPAIKIIDTVSVSAVKVFACQTMSNCAPGVKVWSAALGLVMASNPATWAMALEVSAASAKMD